jgi:O-antigen ligase
MQGARLTNKVTVSMLLVLLGAIGVFFATRAGGPAAGVLAAVACACAVALAAQSDRAAAGARSVSDLFDGLLLVLPGALLIYFSFDSGGYFPAAPAVAAIVLVLVLVLRVTLVDEPFIGFSRPLAVAAAALGLYAVWALVSATWSDAPGRALIEFDRTLAYLLLLVACGSAARTANRLRWMAGTLALAALVIAVTALATRLAPDRFPTSIPAIGESNLAYPLTYSNALGILCVLGAIISLYFATSAHQRTVLRVLGTAALPIFATTVYLTLSRGPVAAAIVGVGAFVLLGRPRGLITGLVAAVPTSVIAIASAYHHPVLSSNTPQATTAAADGHRVALVLALCVVAAAVLRLALVPLDRRLAEFRLPSDKRRPVVAAGWAALVLALVVTAIAVDAPSRVSDQYHRFVNTGQASPTADLRQSVFSSANRGIVDNWSTALDAFKHSPLHGVGAGSYEDWWFAHRPARQAGYPVTDAHSLYVEVLGEVGAVGFVLLLVVLLSILVALAPVRRGTNRPLYAGLFAMALAWAVHAGIDWDWEMPAVTVPFFALGAAALATHERWTLPTFIRQEARIGFGLLLLVVAVAPALVFTSQRQLNEARDDLRAGNCRSAVEQAANSIETLSIRAEPYEVIGLCQAHSGRAGLAVQALREAVAKDPKNWHYHYELAAAQGGAGIDPRPELLLAQRLNPHDPELRQVIKSIPRGESASWSIDVLGPGGAIGAAQG